MQGKFIVFEGVEGCGKTTQIQRMQTWLCSSSSFQTLQSQRYLIDVVLTREPGGTEIGQEIRQLLLTPQSSESIQDTAELLLYAADRAQHVQSFLRPWLDRGSLVLCDRYTDSTIAYQGYGRGLDQALIAQLNQIATGGLESHLTLWLDIDAEVGLARTRLRGESDRLEQASLNFHKRVQKGFQDLANAHPQRIVRVDAMGSETEVAAQIQVIVEQAFKQWYPALLPI